MYALAQPEPPHQLSRLCWQLQPGYVYPGLALHFCVFTEHVRRLRHVTPTPRQGKTTEVFLRFDFKIPGVGGWGSCFGLFRGLPRT